MTVEQLRDFIDGKARAWPNPQDYHLDGNSRRAFLAAQAAGYLLLRGRNEPLGSAWYDWCLVEGRARVVVKLPVSYAPGDSYAQLDMELFLPRLPAGADLTFWELIQKYVDRSHGGNGSWGIRSTLRMVPLALAEKAARELVALGAAVLAEARRPQPESRVAAIPCPCRMVIVRAPEGANHEEIVAQSLRVLEHSAGIFRREQRMFEWVPDGPQVRRVDDAILRGLLARAAIYRQQRRNGTVVDCSPPREVVSEILCSPERWRLPERPAGM